MINDLFIGTEIFQYEAHRGGSRGASSNCVGEQNSDYLLRKTKLKAIFALLHRYSMYLKSASEYMLFGFL